jgi:hypothetical protein
LGIGSTTESGITAVNTGLALFATYSLLETSVAQLLFFSIYSATSFVNRPDAETW